MKKLSFLCLAAALALTACDSKVEQARKEKLETEAKRLERDATETKKVATEDAAAMKRAADAKAEELKREADRVRDQK